MNESSNRPCNLDEQVILKEKMEALERLSRKISHDINNIVTIIQGNADLIQMLGGRESAYAKYVAAIIAGAKKASALASQLSVLNEKRAFRSVPVDLNALLKSFEPKIRGLLYPGITLEFDFDPALLSCMGEHGCIEEVITNLTKNACDAMKKGGCLTIRTSNLEEAHKPSEQKGKTLRWACISVRDSGPGIDASVKSRIFEPFFTTKGRGEADGLGLSRVYGIVRAAEGFVKVENGSSGGSTFIVGFPAVELSE